MARNVKGIGEGIFTAYNTIWQQRKREQELEAQRQADMERLRVQQEFTSSENQKSRDATAAYQNQQRMDAKRKELRGKFDAANATLSDIGVQNTVRNNEDKVYKRLLQEEFGFTDELPTGGYKQYYTERKGMASRASSGGSSPTNPNALVLGEIDGILAPKYLDYLSEDDKYAISDMNGNVDFSKVRPYLPPDVAYQYDMEKKRLIGIAGEKGLGGVYGAGTTNLSPQISRNPPASNYAPNIGIPEPNPSGKTQSPITQQPTMPQRALPAGIPQGSVLMPGAYANGKQVYQAPDGTMWTEE